jgi:heme-degrading monooxygenase HmoA
MREKRRYLLLAAVAALWLAAPPQRGLESAGTPAGGASPKPDPTKPIARIWRGRTLASKADAYEAYLFASGISKVRATPGNLGVTILRRADGEQTEFLVISIWESIEAIQGFAGRDYDKAVILDRDREYLLEVEPNVRHYDVEKEERKR